MKTGLKVTAAAETVRVILIVVASLHSINMVAASVILSGAIRFWLTTRALNRHFNVSAGEIPAATSGAAVVAGFTLIAPAAVSLATDYTTDGLFVPLSVAALGAIAGWFIGVHVSGHPVRAEITYAWRQLRAIARAI